MKYIELNLPTPAANLAADEVLLDACEADLVPELLRFWEPQEPFVVIGYANQAAREVNLDACKTSNIPVYRRCTGGGTVLQGAGCLNYSLFLKIEDSPAVRTISETNKYILDRHQAALQPLVKSVVAIQGCSDLTLNNLKFSGNAQRRKRRFLIFHGTFLLHFNIPLIEKFLRMPSKQPDYRQERGHGEFVTNLELSAETVKAALREIWSANVRVENLPLTQLTEVTQKYTTDEWNFKF